MSKPSFPIAATVEGVAVVTIPAMDYAELLQCRRRLAELGVRASRFERASKSPIERDQAVAAFIAERLGGQTIAEIRAACTAQFGAARTPSQSAVSRFWQRLRASS